MRENQPYPSLGMVATLPSNITNLRELTSIFSPTASGINSLKLVILEEKFGNDPLKL